MNEQMWLEVSVKQNFELRNNFCLLKVWVVQNLSFGLQNYVAFVKKNNYQILTKKKNLKWILS